jgi:hypothetical protein
MTCQPPKDRRRRGAAGLSITASLIERQPFPDVFEPLLFRRCHGRNVLLLRG